MRRAARVDSNQQEIVDALRKVGVKVEIVGKPLDLLLWCRGVTSFMECKTADGRFTKEQVEFMASWPGVIHVAHSPEEAVRQCWVRFT
jgi:hypothetical protein